MTADLLRPRALLRHALVLTVAITCVVLGQWQLDRLGEVRASNALLAERMQAPPRALDDLLAEVTDPAAPDPVAVTDLAFRRVVVTGTFLPDQEVLQRNREHLGASGFHLLTPLDLGDGRSLLVRRGWVPASLDDPPVVEATPAPGLVTLEGILELPVEQPAFGPRDPEDGTLHRVFHPDTSRLDRQTDGALLPLVLRIVPSEQPTGVAKSVPAPLTAPTLNEANHGSYAVQWHVFAVLAVGGYAAWLFSRRRPAA